MLHIKSLKQVTLIRNRHLNNTLPFLQRIEQNYSDLPPSAREIATFLQNDPLQVLKLSTSDIALACNTSKATVSRFFRQLGYKNHLVVKQELRTQGQPIASNNNDKQFLEGEYQRIKAAWEYLQRYGIEQIAEAICNADRISIFGYRNSYPMAMHFQRQLLQLRDRVRLLPQPGQTISEELQGIVKGEVAIVIGFRRRPRVFKSLLTELKKCTSIILLTDSTGQIYKEDVDHLLVCSLGEELAMDSYAAPMSMISMLCHAVYNELGEDATQRSSAISQGYKSLGELEDI